MRSLTRSSSYHTADEQIAAPFQWEFTRADLHQLLTKTSTATRRSRRLTTEYVRGLPSQTT